MKLFFITHHYLSILLISITWPWSLWWDYKYDLHYQLIHYLLFHLQLQIIVLLCKISFCVKN